MGSLLDDEHSDYESDERMDLEMDLDLGTILVGLFTINISPKPDTTMGEIRVVLAEVLGIAPEDVTMTFNKIKLQDSVIVNHYLDEAKCPYNTYYFSIQIKESVEKQVAKRLEQKIMELEDNKKIPRTIILENLNPKYETELTIYKEFFYAYIRRNCK